MNRFLLILIFLFLATISVAWLSLPYLAKHYLEAQMGTRKFSEVVKEADAGNRAALGKMAAPDILLDIPVEPIATALGDELQNSLNLADLGNDWKASLVRSPTVSFHPSAIRVLAPLILSNDNIGAAAVTVQVDVVPSIQGNELVAVPYVTAAALDEVSVRGIHLPGWVASNFSEAISKALDALNTKIPRQRVALNLPEPLLVLPKAQPALLVTNQSVAALLGGSSGTIREIPGSYEDGFVASAKAILPSYVLGSGVIAVRPAESPLLQASEKMRDEASAANLAALEATLGIDAATDINHLGQSVFGGLVMVTAESRYFEQQLKEIVLKAIADLKLKDVVLKTKPEDVAVTLKAGVVEATARGTAMFADNKLSVDFTLTVWGILKPGPVGLVASYALREIKVRSVHVAWADRGATLAVPYDIALGDVAARFIGQLPETLLKIPTVPLKVSSIGGGDFRLVTKEPSLSLSFKGRSVTVAPERIAIFARPSFDGAGESGAQRPIAKGQLERLTALSSKSYQALFGNAKSENLSAAVGKAGFAELIRTAWTRLDPVVTMQHESIDTFDPKEIEIIPGDASCGNPCKGVEQCGNVNQCIKLNCSNVCQSLLGGGWNPVAHLVCKRVCHNDRDEGCFSHIAQCAAEVAKCTGAWGSGLKVTCEAALAAVKLTDMRGIAKISGGTTLHATAATAAASQLNVASDLSGLALAINAGGAASADAWLDITWTDWGNLFLCPSGRLSVHLDVNAKLATSPLTATIGWQPNGDALKGSFSLGKVSVVADATEGPLGKLITGNPGLLSCNLGQTIVGLTALALPHVTQNIIADVIRGVAKGDKANIAAAIIDGHYRYEGEIPTTDFDIPSTDITLLDKAVSLKPRMSDVAVIFGTGAQ
ncbi:hypothetical protein [Rhodopseudomonas parapalustris]